MHRTTLPTGACYAFLTFVRLVSAASTTTDDEDSSQEVTFGVLLGLHGERMLPEYASNASSPRCFDISVHAVQLFVAAQWAAKIINNQTNPDGFRLRASLLDTCGSSDVAIRETVSLTHEAGREQEDGRRLLGIIGEGDEGVLLPVASVLHAYEVPLIVTSSKTSGLPTKFDNVLTTAPDHTSHIKAAASLLKELRWKSVDVVSSESQSIDLVRQEAERIGVRVGRALHVTPRRSPRWLGAAEEFLLKDPSSGYLLSLEPEELEHLGRFLQDSRRFQREGAPCRWVAVTSGSVRASARAWAPPLARGFVVEPLLPEIREFQEYFLGKIETLERLKDDAELHPVLLEYAQREFQCSPDSLPMSAAPNCYALRREDMQERFQQDSRVTFVVKAVSALSAAFRLVQIDRCQLRAHCRAALGRDVHAEVLRALRRLSFTYDGGSAPELGGTRLRFTSSGRLAANQYSVSLLEEGGGLERVGWYSSDQGMLLDRTRLRRHGKSPPPAAAAAAGEEEEEEGRGGGRAFDWPLLLGVRAERRTWAVPALALSSVGVLLALYACMRAAARRRALMSTLLLGAAAQYASVVAYVLPVDRGDGGATAALRDFAPALALALTFGSALLQLLRLRPTAGGSPPASLLDAFLTLLLLVGVQASLCGHAYKLRVSGGGPLDAEGARPWLRFALLRGYLALLLTLALLLSPRARGNERARLVLSCAAALALLAGEAALFFYAPAGFHEPSAAISLLLCATSALCIVFLPQFCPLRAQGRSAAPPAKKFLGTVETVTAAPTEMPIYNAYTCP